MKVVAVSGGFDPLHVGHLRYFMAAKALGDRLVIILNGDSFLMQKKGYVFMPAEERAEILREIRCVDEVYIHYSLRTDVSEAIFILKPDIFAKAGDRNVSNIPKAEIDVCRAIGCQIVDGIENSSPVHSSKLIENLLMHAAVRDAC